MPFMTRNNYVPVTSPNNPPKSRPGYRYVYVFFPGCTERICNFGSCPWHGNCKGEDAPHWREQIVPFPTPTVYIDAAKRFPEDYKT